MDKYTQKIYNPNKNKNNSKNFNDILCVLYFKW